MVANKRYVVCALMSPPSAVRCEDAMKNGEPPFKGIYVLMLGLCLSLVVAGVFYGNLQQLSLDNINRIRTIYAERTESYVNSVFHKTDVLAAVVKLQDGDITEDVFNEVAQIVYTKDSGIRGVQYMPGAIVTYSYPIEGNEAVLGKNFLEIPERRDDCLLAINTRSIALSGPYNLIQGGLGLVARNPIFLTDASGNEYFWGFSAIVLDLPDALVSVGLDNLPESGYDFQLFCTNENGERLVIEGNESLDVSKAVTGTIQVPNHEWTLAIAEIDPWSDMARAGSVLLLGVLLSVIVWRLYCSMLNERAALTAKSKFFSDISHDMRTPLNAIIGFSSLGRGATTTATEKDDYLEKIEASGKLMLDLVNDTLTISKGGSGKLESHPVPTDLIALMDSFLDPVEEMAARKGVILSIDTSGFRRRTVLVDRLGFEKVFLNLLNNAVKFTPEGGHVWFTATDDPAGASAAGVTFEVRDDGIGMSQAFLDKMYEPFAQEQREGYVGTGTGLGLAIVRLVVDVMGGTIEVESHEGAGTTFDVHMRLEETTEAPEDKVAPSSEDRSALRGKKVLLCEDNEMNRQIACSLLEAKGMHVVNAANGREGVDAFAASKVREYDVVLMDLRMPVMNGLEAAQEIRGLGRADSATIPIIAMTADVFAEDVERCRLAGMEWHVGKPIDPDLLYRTLLLAVGARGDAQS